jgi:tRNA(fMet)-specific endonuclease VapC
MSGKKLLLDTNIIIGLFVNDTVIVRKIAEGNELSVPSIVLGELFYGAEQSKRKEENIRKVESFSKLCSVLVCDMKTAKYYGQIKSQLKAKGNPIPENDIWIAALAMQHKLSLVTRDKHFNSIEGLNTTDWL